MKMIILRNSKAQNNMAVKSKMKKAVGKNKILMKIKGKAILKTLLSLETISRLKFHPIRPLIKLFSNN